LLPASGQVPVYNIARHCHSSASSSSSEHPHKHSLSEPAGYSCCAVIVRQSTAQHSTVICSVLLLWCLTSPDAAG
jgi:hypothetical protein